MQGTKRLSTIAGLAALTLSTSSFAIMSVPYGWYIEGNVGSTHTSNTNYPGKTSTSGIGGNANLGYKFMPYFGLEAGYTQYANTTIKNNAGNKGATVKNYSYDLAGRGIVPIVDSGFELFAKIGINRVNANATVDNTPAGASLGMSGSNHSATGLYLGVGGQYYFMPELAANIQWQQANGNNTTGNMNLFSAGLSFIFD